MLNDQKKQEQLFDLDLKEDKQKPTAQEIKIAEKQISFFAKKNNLTYLEATNYIDVVKESGDYIKYKRVEYNYLALIKFAIMLAQKHIEEAKKITSIHRALSI